MTKNRTVCLSVFRKLAILVVVVGVVVVVVVVVIVVVVVVVIVVVVLGVGQLLTQTFDHQANEKVDTCSPVDFYNEYYIILITLNFNPLIIGNIHSNNYIGNRILRNIFLNLKKSLIFLLQIPLFLIKNSLVSKYPSIFFICLVSECPGEQLPDEQLPDEQLFGK